MPENAKKPARKQPPSKSKPRPSRKKTENKALDGELLSEEDLRRLKIGRYLEQFFSAEYIARKMQIPLDEFLERYTDFISDKIEEMTASFAHVMKCKALGVECDGDAKAAAFMLSRLNFEPGEVRVVGAKNQSRPMIIDGKSEGIRPPRITPAIRAALEAENDSESGK